MIRTQIQITREQLRRLRAAAQAQGISVAEVVRRLIDRGIESELPPSEDRWMQAQRVVGAFREPGGASDVATQHDSYLEDAFR
jgi:hypothetical protein